MDEIAIHEKHDSEEEIEEEEYYDGDDFLFDLSMLSQKDLKALRKLYPNLPEYYFKTPSEKKKYFQKLNKSYYNNLKKEPKSQKPSQKKVNFNIGLNQTKGCKIIFIIFQKF